MKLLIAPDSFKGSLTASQAAAAMAEGFAQAGLTQADILPITDGGDGFAPTLLAALTGSWHTATVSDPLGRPVEAGFAVLPDGTAVIEMAQASGICLLRREELSPLTADTFGTGQLLQAAKAEGCTRFLIGLGGSATNDGGTGMLRALGAKFLGDDGRELSPDVPALLELAAIDLSGIDPFWFSAKIDVACDVANPLCGPEGASAVFGPQKGARPEDIKLLDAALARYGRVLDECAGADVQNRPGAGAAGGTGAGLRLFPNAVFRPGFEWAAECTHLAKRLEACDWVITGEGCTDASSACGKVPSGLAAYAKRLGKPLVCISGCLGQGYEKLLPLGVTACFSAVPKPMESRQAMENARENLRACCCQVGRLLRLQSTRGEN